MKTQCPYCKAEQTVPEVYKNKEVKCKKCKKNFLASKYFPPPPKFVARDPLPKGAPGFYLKALGVIGIIVSLLFGFSHDYALSFEGNVYQGLYAGSYAGAQSFLIETIIFGITFLGILLSLILIGLGCVVKSLHKKETTT